MSDKTTDSLRVIDDRHRIRVPTYRLETSDSTRDNKVDYLTCRLTVQGTRRTILIQPSHLLSNVDPSRPWDRKGVYGVYYSHPWSVLSPPTPSRTTVRVSRDTTLLPRRDRGADLSVLTLDEGIVWGQDPDHRVKSTCDTR